MILPTAPQRPRNASGSRMTSSVSRQKWCHLLAPHAPCRVPASPPRGLAPAAPLSASCPPALSSAVHIPSFLHLFPLASQSGPCTCPTKSQVSVCLGGQEVPWGVTSSADPNSTGGLHFHGMEPSSPSPFAPAGSPPSSLPSEGDNHPKYSFPTPSPPFPHSHPSSHPAAGLLNSPP